jgi:hypothetical protein
MGHHQAPRHALRALAVTTAVLAVLVGVPRNATAALSPGDPARQWDQIAQTTVALQAG